MSTHADCQHAPRPPDGVLPCGCTTDVVDRLWARSGRKTPPGRELWSTIEAHVAPYVGPFAGVLHDAEEGGVWGDVLIHRPSPERPSIDLVTAGMSAKRMKLPRALRRRGAAARAELVLRFAPDWLEQPGVGEIVHRDRIWAVRLLASLARFPHEGHGLLGDAPGLDVAQRIVPLPRLPGQSFAGVMVARSCRFGNALPPLRTHPCAVPKSSGLTCFLTIIPLFAPELAYALRRGPDRLFAALAAAGVGDVTRCDRDPVV